MRHLDKLLGEIQDLLDGFGILLAVVVGFLVYWAILTTIVQLVWPGEEPTALWWVVFLGPLAAFFVWAHLPDKPKG